MTIEQEIKNVFHWINLSLDDFEKILNATYRGGHGPNFLASLVGLAITEPVAKLYYPSRRGRGNKPRLVRIRSYSYHGRPLRPESFDDIDAKLAVSRFYADCFSDSRYSVLANFIWDAFRNAHVHLFKPKKIINIPLGGIDNSFLTGVEWTTKNTLTFSLADRKISDHLNFCISGVKKGIIRPAFIFSPLVYYFDLKEAISLFKRRLKTDKILLTRFLRGYHLMAKAGRLDFQGGRIKNTEKRTLLENLGSLLGR